MKTFNILHLLGNGFDLNIGLKTSYSNFYEHYKRVPSDETLIKNLKKEIANNINSWADLEFRLGEYTENINTPEEFELIFEDIGDKLAEYLLDQQNGFDFSKLSHTLFVDCLINPEKHLPHLDMVNIRDFKQPNLHWAVNVATFNYTDSVEIITKFDKATKIGNTSTGQQITLHNVNHIHGQMNDSMVMGVNDESQIKNASLRNSSLVRESFIKTICNQSIKHNIDNWLSLQISRADIICIFGSSIGDTDNHWWEHIGNQLKRDVRVLIFEKGLEIPPRRKYKRAKKERAKKEYFLQKTKLSEKEREAALEKIYVGVNTEMFNILLE